eukprot:12726290-Prorocentrum_lima.AAC.1
MREAGWTDAERLQQFAVNKKDSEGWTYAPRLSEATRLISTLSVKGKAKLLNSGQWGHGIRLFPDPPEIGVDR